MTPLKKRPEITCGAHLGLEGEYTLVITSETTGESRQVGPFKNVITDIGLDRLGTGGAVTYIYVGTGTGTPATTDTGMFTFLAYSSTTQAAGAGTPSGAPDYYSVGSWTKRFAAGVATGNLTEVGIGWATDPAGAIFSHALILDGVGNPTTITILPDEVLDVTYSLRLYPSLTDSTGTVTISGVNYDYIVRSASLPNSPGAYQFGNQGLTGAAGMNVYNGSIGPITGLPSGTSAALGSGTMAAYSSGSLERAATWSAALNQGNVAGGIKSVRSQWQSTNVLTFQCEFTPALPKDATKVMTLTFKASWGRRTI